MFYEDYRRSEQELTQIEFAVEVIKEEYLYPACVAQTMQIGGLALVKTMRSLYENERNLIPNLEGWMGHLGRYNDDAVGEIIYHAGELASNDNQDSHINQNINSIPENGIAWITHKKPGMRY